MGIGSGEAPDVPTVVPTPPLDEEAAPEPEGPEAASRQSGGAGIRTLKPVRAPHFECGALPFCHPSGVAYCCYVLPGHNSAGSSPFCHPSVSVTSRR